MFIELAIGLLGVLIGAMLTHLYYDMKKSPEAADDNLMGFKEAEVVERMDAPLYDVELGIDEYLSYSYDAEGVWVEVEIQNDCGHGCKIYEHSKTGRRALAHNSAYGCKRSFNMIQE